MPHETLVLLI